MALTPAQITTLRRAFRDVCRGYSTASHQGTALYLRHLSHQQQLDYEDIQERYHREALSQGALTETVRLEQLVKQGLWAHSREDEIAQQKDLISRLESGLKQMSQISMVRTTTAQIEAEKTKLYQMLGKRGAALGITAEAYARQRLNDHYILTNLYRDPLFTVPAVGGEAFDDMSDSEVQGLVDVYNATSEPCSDANLRLLSVQDFFISYFNLCGDTLSDFFGRPVAEMTYYMIRLGSAAKYFKGLLENMDTRGLRPDERGDPEAIERTYLSQKNLAHDQAAGRVSNVGMTKEDIRASGMEGRMAKLPDRNLNNINDFMGFIKKNVTPEAG